MKNAAICFMIINLDRCVEPLKGFLRFWTKRKEGGEKWPLICCKLALMKGGSKQKPACESKAFTAPYRWGINAVIPSAKLGDPLIILYRMLGCRVPIKIVHDCQESMIWSSTVMISGISDQCFVMEFIYRRGSSCICDTVGDVVTLPRGGAAANWRTIPINATDVTIKTIQHSKTADRHFCRFIFWEPWLEPDRWREFWMCFQDPGILENPGKSIQLPYGRMGTVHAVAASI